MTNKSRDRERILGEEHLSAKGGAREHGLTRAADLELHIEELVLTGFAESDRHRIGDSVEHELFRLLTASKPSVIADIPFAVERLDAGKFKVAQGARPQSIGGQIAQALHRAISPVQKQAAQNNALKR